MVVATILIFFLSLFETKQPYCVFVDQLWVS